VTGNKVTKEELFECAETLSNILYEILSDEEQYLHMRKTLGFTD